MRKYRFGRLKAKATEILDIPQDVLLGMSCVTITGNIRVHIDNHCGLIEYGPEEIAVKAQEGIIRLAGKGMLIAEFESKRLIITGTIQRVHFGRKNVD